MDATNTKGKKFDDIIHRFFIHQVTNEEIRLLREWIKSNPANERYFDNCRSVWQAGKYAHRIFFYNEDEAWNELKIKLLSEKTEKVVWLGFRHLAVRNFQKIAAILIISFISGALITWLMNRGDKLNPQSSLVVYNVPRGSKSQLILPDGSKVWLNSGSTLRYSLQFNRSTRDVYLEGEGFFDVQKNPKVPFRVKTANITVKVLGTAFNVKAYPDEKTVETTVERGLVQVMANHLKGNSKVFIRPHQKAVYAKKVKAEYSGQTGRLPELKGQGGGEDGCLTVCGKADVGAITSWKDNRWIIEREDLQSLAVRIERRYNVKICFAEDGLKSLKFSGVFEDETLEQVLNAIKMSSTICYKIERNIVYLYKQKR